MSEETAGEPSVEQGGSELSTLAPVGGEHSVERVVEQLGLWDRPADTPRRPRVLLNMIATLDGRASLSGRSGALSGPADRALFHALRTAVDGVLVGAGTVRSEHYRGLIRDPAGRELRVKRGLSAEPLACVVSARLDLGPDIPLMGDPDARVVILTPSEGTLEGCRAQVDYVRTGAGHLDLASALAELSRRFDVRTLLCEGGPHLAGELFAAGVLDELLLTLAPIVAGEDPTSGAGLRIVSGRELDPPAELNLLGVLRSGSFLFLRYAVSARERVSRETTLSNSLAS